MVWVRLEGCQNSYRSTGEPSFRRAAGYGETKEAGWTLEGDTLVVSSDPLGVVPLYYCETPDLFVCSDRVLELFKAGIAIAIDPLLLALNRALSFCPSDMTIFKNVRRVPPGAMLTRKANGAVSIQADPVVPKQLPLSREDAAQSYADLFETALRRLTAQHDRLSVPLSGGRDSRHILFAAKRLGKDVQTLTFESFPPVGTNMETAVALSRRLGCQHWRLDNSEYTFHESFVRALVEIDFESMQHGWMWALISKVAAIGRPFVDGLGGDVLSNSLFFSLETNRLMRQGHLQAVADAIARNVVAGPARALFHDRNGAERERLNQLLLTELSRWQAWPNPQIAATFFNRTRRAIGVAPLAISRLTGVPCVFPYLEEGVFNFLMGLDECIFATGGFHDETIQKKYPEYADTPYGVPKGSGRLGYAMSVRNIVPYLRALKPERIVRGEGIREAIGIAMVLFGADFGREIWRFADFDLASAIAITRAQCART